MSTRLADKLGAGGMSHLFAQHDGTDHAQMAAVTLNCAFYHQSLTRRKEIHGNNNTYVETIFNDMVSDMDFDAVHGEGAWAPMGPDDHDGQDRLRCITSFNRVPINKATAASFANTTFYVWQPDALSPTGGTVVAIRPPLTGADPNSDAAKLHAAWAKYRALQRDWKFVGVVNTPVAKYQNRGTSNHTDHVPDLAVLSQGTISIQNTSGRTVNAMDWIRAVLPGRPYSNGDHQKSQAPLTIEGNGISETKAVTIYEAINPKELLELFLERVVRENGMDVTTLDYKKIAADFRHELGCVIGIALSTARPGHRFDIQLSRPLC